MYIVYIFLVFKVQKVFFSATMPRNVIALAERSMINPITVHVGRAGAANLDVIQEVSLSFSFQVYASVDIPQYIMCSSVYFWDRISSGVFLFFDEQIGLSESHLVA